MRLRVVMSWAVVMALAFSPVAHATLQGDYLAIYLKLNDSERLERNGDFRGALEGFEDCYAKLHKIHVNNPDWESVLVTSRMEDCRAKIAELQPKVEDTIENPAPAAPSTSGDTPAPVNSTPPLAAGIEDTATLKSRLQEVENELEQTKQQIIDVQAKYKNSQLEVDALHAQLATVNDQLTALRSSATVDQNVGQLMAQNKELTDRLSSAQAEIRALSGSPGSKTSKLAAQLKAMQDKLAASEAANAGLTETTSTLRSQLDQAQNDLAIANQKLAASGPGTPEYLTLKRENEVMRGFLVREIQEQARRDGAKRVAQEEFDRLKINSRVLQEQLDILGSPVTPPINDDERALLTSLKTGTGGVMPMADNSGAGNRLAAQANGAPVQEGNVTAPMDTNAAAANPVPPAAETNVVANPPASAPSLPSTPGVTPSTDTNSVANVTPPATNAPPAPDVTVSTNTAPASSAPPLATAPATNVPPAVAGDTNAVPTNAAPPSSPVASTPTPPPAPPAADTNVTATPAPPTPPAPSTNTPPATPPANNSTSADASRYSYKPRLPDDMREVAQEATDLFKMQRYDEAAAKYQTIIDKYPESLYAWSNLGVVRSQEGKLQEAMKALQQAVKLSPNDAFSYRNLGIVYYQLNQNDAAIDALERSIALDPNNVYSHDYLGCACSQKGWQQVAEQEFQKAIEINDDFPDAHYNLAIVYAMQKPPALELARRNYKRALDLGLPKDPRLEKLLGL